MPQNLQIMTDLFVSNAQSIKKDFIWQNTIIKRLAALIYAAEGKTVDSVAIRESHELIKQGTGAFSMMRGNLVVCIAAIISLSDDRKQLFSNILTAYDTLKANGFKKSDYLVFAAYLIAANSKEEDYVQAVGRSKAFYSGMKEKHFFLTGKDDYIFSVMLGLSKIEVQSGVDNIESFYQQLKPEFLSKSSLQTLCQVLTLIGGDENTASKVLELRHALRQQGIRLDKEYTLSSLGILSVLKVEIADLVSDVNNIFEYLRTQKGFGFWSVSKQECLLLAASLVAFAHADETNSGVTAANISTNITSIIIAQQTAVLVAASSGSVAASAGSSS